MFSALAYVAIYSAVGTTSFVSGYLVDVTNNGPVVQGATIQFKAEVFDDNGELNEGDFQYTWIDTRYPEHNLTYETNSPVSHWNISTNSSYMSGEHKVHLIVKQRIRFIIPLILSTIFDEKLNFTITEFLNGELILMQGNFTRGKYVNSAVPLNQSVVLNLPDLEYLNKTKNYVRSFWFIDCVYYGQLSGFKYEFNFSKPESRHMVQALIVATKVPVNFTLDEIPIIPGNSSDIKNETESKSAESQVTVKNVSDPHEPFKEWLRTFNKTHVKGNYSSGAFDTCFNISSVPMNKNYTYGLFSNNFTVKEPVKVSPINGTSWLKDGEILNITVSCTGSPPFKYCIWMRSGLYNVTGKEKCEEEVKIRNCSFNIQHLFRDSPEYTVVVFLSNTVSQVIKPIAVNIYKVTKHPQLSVIIVPVAFSIVAVILVIFGVAFYVQSKRRYTVEVADFDFANQSSDMEYKSFGERLRESVSNLFLKSNDFDDDDQVRSPTRKYGSMQ